MLQTEFSLNDINLCIFDLEIWHRLCVTETLVIRVLTAKPAYAKAARGKTCQC